MAGVWYGFIVFIVVAVMLVMVYYGGSFSEGMLAMCNIEDFEVDTPGIYALWGNYNDFVPIVSLYMWDGTEWSNELASCVLDAEDDLEDVVPYQRAVNKCLTAIGKDYGHLKGEFSCW